MQQQQVNIESQVNNSALPAGPVEIDARLLDRIGGGTPKGTWTEPELLVAATDPNLTPKGTW